MYVATYVITCDVYRFVDANGNQYYPAKEVDGPYGSTFAFTGPKVNDICFYRAKGKWNH